MKNVVLFTLDTLRKDVFGCHGNTENLTPFVDSIQDTCIRFTKAQSIGPYTQASFPGILTSSYYLQYDGGPMYTPKRTLISDVVKQQDVATAAFHSNPYLCEYFGWNRGWDTFYDSMDDEVTDLSPYIKGDVINTKVDEWLSRHVGGGDTYRPFFLWAHYMDVHEPYAPDKKYVDRIDSSIDMTDDDYMALFKEVILPRNAADASKVELCRKLYKAHVAEVDDYVRAFFDILEKRGVLDDSVVIITADHGDEFGDHGGVSHDGKMFAELIHVPLFVYDRSVEKGEVCDALVSNVDIPPTILGLFGQAPHENFQGRSLLPLGDYVPGGVYGNAIGKLSHKVKETDKPVHFYMEDDLKIIYREEGDEWALYDLGKDPREETDIVGVSDETEAMKQKLKAMANVYSKKA